MRGLSSSRKREKDCDDGVQGEEGKEEEGEGERDSADERERGGVSSCGTILTSQVCEDNPSSASSFSLTFLSGNCSETGGS